LTEGKTDSVDEDEDEAGDGDDEGKDDVQGMPDDDWDDDAGGFHWRETWLQQQLLPSTQ